MDNEEIDISEYYFGNKFFLAILIENNEKNYILHENRIIICKNLVLSQNDNFV